jgi:hypothetical protein
VKKLAAQRKPLTARQEQAALSLAAGYSVPQTAQRVGVTDRAVYHWKRHALFKARVAELQQQLFEQVAALTANMLLGAGVRLNALKDSANEAVSLGACRSIFDVALRLREHVDHEQRIAALEAAQQQRDM